MTDKSRFSGHVKMVGGKELIEQYANEREFESESAFARFLHEIEPTRSVDGWRGAIMRWKKGGGQITYTVWNGTKKTGAKDAPHSVKEQYAVAPPTVTKTYYDEAQDLYLTFIPQCDNMITVDGDKHRKMRRAYSDSGGRLTVEQMSTEFEIPVLWMRDYIRAWSWKHPMSPYTDEELVNKSEDELVMDYLEIKRNAVLERSKRSHFAAAMKDANKWRHLDDAF